MPIDGDADVRRARRARLLAGLLGDMRRTLEQESASPGEPLPALLAAELATAAEDLAGCEVLADLWARGGLKE